MSYQQVPSDFRPATGEAPFALDEVFFSRTDKRGVIQAGNEVFRRVADFDWDDLIGAPHRVIRHPDMPRGVFWLLWDRIQKGHFIGAYVKNLARDGLSYWVFAAVAPCEGGYLSARIKPTGKMFAVIQEEYAALLAAEKSENLTPEASAKRLLARLNELGYSEYDIFASEAMNLELRARDAGMHNDLDLNLSRFDAMITAATALKDDTNSLIHVFHQMRTIPHNMQVIASRLEPTGGPVSTLSKNYGAISREMSDWFETNIAHEGSNFASIRITIETSLFLECMVRVLHECDAQLTRETLTTDKVDIENERRILHDQLETFLKQSKDGLAKVGSEADRILRTCDMMNRHVTGLSSTRILAKIEAGRIQNAGEGLGDIITQLGTFQQRIADQLAKIAEKSEAILKNID